MRNGKADCVLLADGKTGIEWANSEKPCLNHWYRTMDGEKDFGRLQKISIHPKPGLTITRLSNIIMAIFCMLVVHCALFVRSCATTLTGW